jgi:hypothetical protein
MFSLLTGQGHHAPSFPMGPCHHVLAGFGHIGGRERNWELSIGGYGGWVFPGGSFMATQHFKTTNYSTAQNLRPGICPGNTVGSRKIGREIDWTMFTADVPAGQEVPGFGIFLSTVTPIGFVIFTVAPEFAVDNMAFNLLFRYPIWATDDMPQGRWYPYVGIGGGAQRARLSIQGFEETSYSHFRSGIDRYQILSDQVSGRLR